MQGSLTWRGAQMDLSGAIELLRKNYEKALKLHYVQNPLAWALYHTWKTVDTEKRGEREANERNDNNYHNSAH